MKRRSGWPQGLKARKRAGGKILYWWEPSDTLRKKGWKSERLGFDLADAINAAKAINKRVAAWREGVRIAGNDLAPSIAAMTTIGDLVHAFRTTELNRIEPGTDRPVYKPSTIAEYKTRLKWIFDWADGGKTRVSDIDHDICIDLRNLLVESASPYKAAGILRVLGVLFNFAERRKVIPRGSNPARKLDIPTPPRRRKRTTIDAVHFLVEIADNAGLPDAGTAIALGFYTTQREADLVAMTRFNLVTAHDVAEIDRQTLGDEKGIVKGIDVRQQKTDAALIAFIPLWLRQRIERTFAERDREGRQCQHLLHYPVTAQSVQQNGALDPDRPCPNWKLQRVWRQIILRDAIKQARKEGNNWLVDQLTGLQLRDLRRSGMCWMRDMGASISQIAAISRHSIEYTKKILDTYLPADPRAAAAGLGHALRTQASHDAMFHGKQDAD